jgi:hypothetical protein
MHPLLRSTRIITLLALSFAAVATVDRLLAQSVPWIEAYREPAARLIGESLSTRFAWERLAYLTDMFGHRLSGSRALEEAIQWAVDTMKKDGLENVRAEPVKVPHWVRGQESAEIVAPRRHPMVMLGLGNSVGTPPDGIEAEVVVVRTFSELDAAAERVKGRIVLYNVPFTTYGETVQYRSSGPSRAAAFGAVAVLVRSVGPPGLRTPHTGALRYTEGQPRIPAAAITVEDAERVQRMQDRHAGSCAAQDGGAIPPRCRLGERGRRDSRSSGRTELLWSADTSTRGTWARAPPTTEAGDVGSAAADAEAESETSAAPYGSCCGRTKKTACGRTRLSRALSRSAAQSRADAGIR